MNWREFCQQRAGVSRKTAEQITRRLEEFGPQYFTLAQVTGVTPEEYRRIAGSVGAQGLVHAGVTIPIAAENAPRLTEAVGAPRRPPKPAPGAEETSAPDRTSGARAIGKVERLLSSAVACIEHLHATPLDARQNDRLSGIVTAHLKRLSIARAAAFRSRR
jgi:hypothetical protein